MTLQYHQMLSPSSENRCARLAAGQARCVADAAARPTAAPPARPRRGRSIGKHVKPPPQPCRRQGLQRRISPWQQRPGFPASL